MEIGILGKAESKYVLVEEYWSSFWGKLMAQIEIFHFVCQNISVLNYTQVLKIENRLINNDL